MKLKNLKIARGLIVLALLLLANSLSSQYYPDRGEWQSKKPSEYGIDESRLNEALDFAKANEYSGSRDLRIAILTSFGNEPYIEVVGPTKERGGPAGMVLKDGYIIAQWGDIDRVDMTFSVTKSYLSTVVGIAWDKGLIASLSDPVYKYVWDGTFDGEHNMKITWEHLLNQSSDWSGTLFGMPDWSDRPQRGQGLDEWKYRELHEPGTFFKYNDVRVNLLAYSALQVLREPLPQVLKREIMDPIGASSTWRWYGYSTSWVDMDGAKVQSVSGGAHSGGGIFISTTDHARVGLLFERNGKWEEKQLISREWIDMSRQSSPANEAYGYMWWLNRGRGAFKEVPQSVFYASGFGGNYIVVDQENSLVIVTRWLEPSKLGEFLKLVYGSF
ncbi:MAG: class C beta-lactamase-related serine hydrolase [Bacteroidia bacterium]|nr:MAG: class C beta-lactamase-related serine hydrolase [Bacteroidia bacterium]